MSEVTIIFPHQLFENHPAIIPSRPVALIEEGLLFKQFRFHKKKLVLHRASMKAYEQRLRTKRNQVHYFNATDSKSLKEIIGELNAQGYSTIHYVAPEDYLLERRLRRYALMFGMKMCEYESPMFLCSNSYLNDLFEKKSRYFMQDFYIEQRRRLGVLTDGDGPIGGRWSFDADNRRKMPASVVVPVLPKFSSLFLDEAISYVNNNFTANYGDTEEFNYPTTRDEALTGLKIFLEQRFVNYGIYQDAIIDNNSYLFHSILTPALNVGLVTPDEVLELSLEYARQKNIPINSLEGFVRQIVGWREFIRALYIREGVKQRKQNHWDHKNPIPGSFWAGTTGILPVDNVIKKVLRSSYSNHIERLMVIGNFMLLCEFDPDDVYRWFMELYIDAYDWVMVPNVYGMSQFADGGLMSTKPYISGSNYLLKMSNFKKGEWCEVWDALYWSFIEKHRNEFIRNPRMSMMVRQLDNMNGDRRKSLYHSREKFLSRIY